MSEKPEENDEEDLVPTNSLTKNDVQDGSTITPPDPDWSRIRGVTGITGPVHWMGDPRVTMAPLVPTTLRHVDFPRDDDGEVVARRDPALDDQVMDDEWTIPGQNIR